MSLPRRWQPLRPHRVQHSYWKSPHRFTVVPAGRRSGKSEYAKRRLVRAALRGTGFDRPRFFAAAPTYGQARRIYWDDLKALVPPQVLARRPSETKMIINLVNGAELYVVGMDRPERLEGVPYDGGVLDEYGNMKPEAWTLNVRPTLSDRNGWCDLIGVPEGRNHYYELYERARADQLADGDASDWGAFHWKSADILPASEIAAAKHDLDELSFQQEYEASFVTFAGRAYYSFHPEEHDAVLEYRPEAELCLCFDFNVDPGVCCYVQESTTTDVFGEVFIPRNSNTVLVCEKIIADFPKHKGRVTCFGDASGGARGSAQLMGGDWELIKRTLRPHFGSRLAFEVPKANGSERVRVSALNSRCCSVDGTRRLRIDPSKAPKTKRDLQGVRLVDGGAGQIDKRHDASLTHLSDALGYYVVQRFPLREGRVEFMPLGGSL